MSAGVSGALAGYRVLDLTHVLAGPFCCYQLGVLGAEVIKIEPPHRPDMMRAEGPDARLADQGLGLHFQSQNAGKQSMTLDIKTEPGREVLNRLLASADVLVTNYRRGSQQRLRLDWRSVQSINPRLITCSITGFGQSGPKADDAAYDNVIQAYSGLLCATGHSADEAVKVGPPVLDYGTGAQAALAVTAALLLRERTGQVSHLDVSMLDAALMLMTSSVTETAYTRRAPAPHGNSSPNRAGYGCYETADGRLMIGAFTSRQNALLWRTLGDDEVANEVETLTPADLDARYSHDKAQLQTCFIKQTAAYWEEVLNQAGLPAARVRTLDETLSEPQLQSRSVLFSTHQSVASGPAAKNDSTDRNSSSNRVTTFARKAWNTEYPDGPDSPDSDSSNTTRGVAGDQSLQDAIEYEPAVTGQHNVKLLQELGFTAAEIAGLQRNKVV